MNTSIGEKVKEVYRCKICKKIYPNELREKCSCGAVLGEKIPKIERLNRMAIPGATITFNPAVFEGYEEGVLRMTDDCEFVLARKRIFHKWEVQDGSKGGN